MFMVIKLTRARATTARPSALLTSISSECIVTNNVGKVNAQYCANVCLKINMKLCGKNSVLRGVFFVVSYTVPSVARVCASKSNDANIAQLLLMRTGILLVQ